MKSKTLLQLGLASVARLNNNLKCWLREQQTWALAVLWQNLNKYCINRTIPNKKNKQFCPLPRQMMLY